jgi:RNA polymerase sigma factor (sigma-70 family)
LPRSSTPTRTNTVLLLGVADPSNQAAWQQFDARYRPIVVEFARRFGLQDAEADDVAQDVMLRVVQDFRAGKFDSTRGRLRSWLYTIARSRVFDARRARARRRVTRGDSALSEKLDDATVSRFFDEEWRRELLRTALAELRAARRVDAPTLRVFEQIVLERRRAADVARELGMTLGAVYVAKHRTLGRLRTILARLQQDF